MPRKSRKITKISYDKRCNAFRGSDGKFVSPKNIVYDARTNQFKYRRGNYTKVVNVEGIYVKKTPAGDYHFRNTKGRFTRINVIKPKVEKPKPKAPTVPKKIVEIQTRSQDITDFFTHYRDTTTDTEQFILLEYRETQLISMITQEYNSIINANPSANIRIYLYGEFYDSTSSEPKIISSFTIQSPSTSEIYRMIDDFIEKVTDLLNSVKYIESLRGNTTYVDILKKYTIELVIKFW